MALLFTTTLFLLLSAIFFSFSLRALEGRAYLLVPEKVAATITFYFYVLTLAGFLLGFLGLFTIVGFLVILAAVCAGLFAIQFLLPERRERLMIWRMFLEYLRDLNPAAWLALIAATVSALYFLVIGVILPVNDFDGLSYHLGLAVHMFQDGDFRYYPGESGYVNHFARGGEMLMAVLIMLVRSIALVNAFQWLIVPPLVLSVYSAARNQGLTRSHATIAAAAPLAVPVILYQTSIAYVDLWSLGWFAIGLCAVLGSARQEEVGPARVIWMFAAAGLALAAKFNAVTPLLVLGITAAVAWGFRTLFVVRLGSLLLGLLLSALIGMPWMMNNWARYGSPIYPYAVEVGSVTIAKGPFPTKTIRLMPEAPPYRDMPLYEKAYLSWTTIDLESWEKINPLSMSELPKDVLNSSDFGYRGDNKLGGYGIAWPLLYLPSLLLLAVLTPFVHWRTIVPKRYLLALAIAPLAAFLLIVAAWWPRFALFLPIFGALAFLFLVQEAKERNRTLGTVLLVVFLLLAGFDWTTCVMMNRERERARRYYSEYAQASLAPINFFRWAAPDHQEFQAIETLMDEARPGETISYFTPDVGTFTGYFIDEKAEMRLFPFPAIWPRPDTFTNEQLMEFVDKERIALLLAGPTVDDSFTTAVMNKGANEFYRNDNGFVIHEFPENRVEFAGIQ
jgi:hypothetical protein